MREYCPVCGSSVDEGGALEYAVEGHALKFCGLNCLHIFQQFPEAYLGLEEPSAQLVEDSTVS